MLALSIQFTAGRYHATPWGRHVNEGAVEWPPSPWRILRALIAVWHRKFSTEISEALIRHIVEQLAELPVYHLPKAALGHTRHFMPQAKYPATSKVFDAFVTVLPTDSLIVAWSNITMNEEEKDVLKLLVSGLSYLGRAESWVSVQVSDQWNGEANCFPIESEMTIEEERVRVLATMSPAMFVEWKEHFLVKAVGATVTSTKTSKKKTPPPSPVAVDLWDALHAETSELQKQGWSAAPGSRWIDYVRPHEAFRVTYQRKVQVEPIRPTVARFAIHSSVLPRLTDALFIGERMRQALMAHSRGRNGTEHALPVFSGKGLDGLPLHDDHTHSYYLSSDEDDDGRIDHLTIYATQGFDKNAQQALGTVKKLWGSGGHDIRTILIGIGQPADYGGFEEQQGLARMLGEAQTWRSTTPYMLTRHPKRNGKDAPALQIRKDLVRRGFPDPISITPIEQTKIAGKNIRWLEFRRYRKKGGGYLANPQGFGFEIDFAEPVRGPIALGYACHFGLGQFLAVRDHIN